MSPKKHPYRIADVHAHIYPDKIAEKATRSVASFYDVEMAVKAGTPEALLANGSEIGCERYLVCSVATKLEQVDSITDYIARECAAHPEFIGLGAYHPDVADPVAALDRIQDLGLRGVKIHPDFQRFDIDDPRMLPAYRELAARRLPILIHMGDDRTTFSAPKRLGHVLEQVPDLVVIAAHFGGYRAWGEAAMTFAEIRDLAGSNVHFDTSSSLYFLRPECAASLVRFFGAERMMFGVDFPMWNHARELDRFFEMGLTARENKAILYDNFARLFGLDNAC
ncbi:MAG: amidohydrolase family protein [Atopobiaceae bacterium]